MVATCPHHHLQLHEGGWSLRPRPDHRFDAIRADGLVLHPAPTTRGGTNDLRTAHDADIDPKTVTGSWAGEPLDLDYAVSVHA